MQRNPDFEIRLTALGYLLNNPRASQLVLYEFPPCAELLLDGRALSSGQLFILRKVTML